MGIHLHSCCVRILRRYIDRIGYENNFSIYDTDDSKAILKEVLRRLELDPKIYKEKALLVKISAAKNEMISPEEYERSAEKWEDRKTAEVYGEYQAQLRKNNALDFDDLLIKTVELFRQCPEVLEYYQERFRYIHIDEFQDTNRVQFLFVRYLAARYKNLCVVGDDDQSIYRFRGADIRNILDFEKAFPDAYVVRLEQNYRSVGNILEAANEVIVHNRDRKAKRLWTDNIPGGRVRLAQLRTGFDEADFVARDIAERRAAGAKLSDFAVLYRTNAQSRLFEEKFLLSNIPYRIVGGINFYSRKEIKDILAYLKTIDNGRDDLSVQRIINIPKRSIGGTSVNRAENYAAEEDFSFFDALLEADRIPGMGKAALKIKGFTNFILTLRAQSAYIGVSSLIQKILEETGYRKELVEENTEESKARIENLDELVSKAAEYENSAETPTLSGFLQEVALVADIDLVDTEADRVMLMTFHGAKGLEFEHVYMAGMEDGLFPGHMSISSGDSADLEEERRLCYVGITRAKRTLTLTSAQMRVVRGEQQYSNTSRFVNEIPPELIEEVRGSVFGRSTSRYSAEGTGAFGRSTSRYSAEGTGAFGRKAAAGGNAAFTRKAGASGWDPRSFKVQKASSLDYGPRDRVSHVKFGEGTVLEIRDGGRDYEVTVDFDKCGVKKMFASFAKLRKC